MTASQKKSTRSRRPRRQKSRRMVIFLIICHVLGAISSIHAIMSTRTAQGAVAWAVSLNTFPYVAVPTYWVLGRNKFQGYVSARQLVDEQLLQVAPEVRAHVEEYMIAHDELTPALKMVDTLTDMPFTDGNEMELLIDGEATFASILEGIAQAKNYILFQFFIVKDDEIGGQIKDALIARARDGVRVFFLYDEVGSNKLPKRYRRDLEEAGIEVSPFNTTQGQRNRFQINFRNHRKIVVVDATPIAGFTDLPSSAPRSPSPRTGTGRRERCQRSTGYQIRHRPAMSKRW